MTDNVSNYPANYRAYFETLPQAGRLPPKPNRCSRCGDTFSDGQSLNQHIRGGCR